jgi:hypothetical protein
LLSTVWASLRAVKRAKATVKAAAATADKHQPDFPSVVRAHQVA